MYRIFHIISIALLFNISYSQISYQEGYYIDNNGQKTTCLINLDQTGNNPKSFTYKLRENSKVKTLEIDQVQEFGVKNPSFIFERHQVEIDDSKNSLDSLDLNKAPNISNKTLFLRLEEKGEAILYSYKSSGIPRKFFYKVPNREVELLIHKIYLSENNVPQSNDQYKRDLYRDLRDCRSISLKNFNELKYNKQSLRGLFTKYNDCLDSGIEQRTDYKPQAEVNYSLKIGGTNAEIETDQKPLEYQRTQNLPAFISPQVGFEIEYVFAFRRKSLSIFIDPNILFMKTIHETYLISGPTGIPSNPEGYIASTTNLEIDYTHISLPLGIRLYAFKKENRALYFQTSYSHNFLINPENTYKTDFQYFTTEQSKISSSMDFGAGLKIKKLGMELIYTPNKIVTSQNFEFTGRIQNLLSLRLVYSL